MRVWDLPPELLCRQHLLGEHAEVHAVWAILTQGKAGYASHPEVERWQGKLRALYNRHEQIVEAMEHRGFAHRSPLDPELATGSRRQRAYLQSPAEQRRILRRKGCGCQV